MQARLVFLINAAVSLLYAISFLFTPGQVAELYGTELAAGGTLVARLYGGTLVTFVMILWAARNLGPTSARQALLLALFVGDVIGFAVTLLAVLDGTTNTLGWVSVVTFGLFAAAYGYLRFAGEAVAPPPEMAR